MGSGATKPELQIAALTSESSLNAVHADENQVDMQHMTKHEDIPVIDENLEYPNIPQQIHPSNNTISRRNPLDFPSSPLRGSAINSIISENPTDFFESSKKEPNQIIENVDSSPASNQVSAKTAEEYVIDDALQMNAQESKENIPENAFSLHAIKSERKFERSNILEISSLAYSLSSSPSSNIPEDPLGAYAPSQEFASTGSANFNFDLIDESKKCSLPDIKKEQKITNIHDVNQLLEELDL
jgi:hypothetical protein